MIAYQVAAKAARDALFLEVYGIDALPRMIIATAVFSVAAALLTSRLLARLGPARVVAAGFALSGILMLAIWPLYYASRGAAAIALYLHLSVGGSVLISWFWSLVNERFDPRTAKKRIGRIAGGGTLGGIGGGILAERAAAVAAIPPEALLPILAALHLACAVVLLAVRARGTGAPAARAGAGSGETPFSGLGTLRRNRYLRDLAILVMAGTVAATFVDFIFKSHAAVRFPTGEELLRFFAVFHTATGLATFLVQSLVTGRLLQETGPARTSATLPFAIGLGGASLLLPWTWGLSMATAVRGLESVLRSSVFRSGYELFYTPVAPHDKRSTKPLIDVGCDRCGDAIGGLAIQLVLWATAGAATGVAATASRASLLPLAALVVILSLMGLRQGRRLHRGYVATLEQSLLDRRKLAPSGVLADDATRTAFLRTVGHLDVSSFVDEPTPPEPPTSRDSSLVADPLLRRIAVLRSGDLDQVRYALQSEPLPPAAVPHVIRLLGWDEMQREAVRALRTVCERHTGQLLDALLDSEEEFVIRRRIPRILAVGSTDRVVAGLLQGLEDRRFEVRYQSGVALARIHRRHPALPIGRNAIHEAVLRELAVDRRVWESQRILDQVEEGEESSFLDELLRKRTSHCLEHIFTLLSLTYPEQPLLIAFKGLHTEDENLRGTALEYLESILPAGIWDGLRPFVEDREPRPSEGQKPGAEILDSLLRSHDSIRLSLERLRDQSEATTTRPADEPGSPDEGARDDDIHDHRPRPNPGGPG
jgi:hypothetical protein